MSRPRSGDCDRREGGLVDRRRHGCLQVASDHIDVADRSFEPRALLQNDSTPGRLDPPLHRTPDEGAAALVLDRTLHRHKRIVLLPKMTRRTTDGVESEG